MVQPGAHWLLNAQMQVIWYVPERHLNAHAQPVNIGKFHLNTKSNYSENNVSGIVTWSDVTLYTDVMWRE